jgi:hypothetical protein
MDQSLTSISPDNIHSIFFGINIGLTVIGVLFYIIRLTGPLKSWRSFAYLFTVISLGGISVSAFLLYFKVGGVKSYIYHILDIVFAQGAAGYFLILVMNTLLVLDRKWIYIILSIPLPAIILLEIWIFSLLVEDLDIKTNINLELLGILSTSLTCITDFLINVICYFNFRKYKDIQALNELLNQYASGSIFSLLLDIAFIALSQIFKFDNLTMGQVATVALFINLNIEYFLLYQIRLVLLSQIQIHNS